MDPGIQLYGLGEVKKKAIIIYLKIQYINSNIKLQWLNKMLLSSCTGFGGSLRRGEAQGHDFLDFPARSFQTNIPFIVKNNSNIYTITQATTKNWSPKWPKN